MDHLFTVDRGRSQITSSRTKVGGSYSIAGISISPLNMCRRLAGDFAHRRPGAVNSVCTSPPRSRRVRVCVCAGVCSVHLLVPRRPLEGVVENPAQGLPGGRAQELVKAACGTHKSMLPSRPHHPDTPPRKELPALPVSWSSCRHARPSRCCASAHACVHPCIPIPMLLPPSPPLSAPLQPSSFFHT